MQTFKRNLLIGYGLSLLLLVISAVASYISINNLLFITKEVNQTNTVMTKIDSVMSALKDAETGQRGYLLTGEAQFLEPYNGAYARSLGLLSEVKQLTAENPQQQVDAEWLRNVITKRLNVLQLLINEKNEGKTITTAQLTVGKNYMDTVRRIATGMQNRARQQFEDHTRLQGRFAAATPILILVAAALAIIVTIVSFGRVSGDYNKRAALQQELQQKDEETSRRLGIIRNIADTISSGDYKTRVDDEKQDALGNIAGSLNRMAESLDLAFTNLSDKEWMQTGIARLNEKMIGERNIETLTYKIVEFVAAYTEAPVAAFFVVRDENTLVLSSGIALDRNRAHKELQLGEHLAGQTAVSRKLTVLKDIEDSDMLINFTAGSIRPKVVVAVPVFFETKLKGVLELGYLQTYRPIVHDFLHVAAYNMGMALRSAKDHLRLQELLHETQAQSEELQSQHNELEGINTELELQAEKLQASEEELRVQQEELQQANRELEERSRLLEEKNELILERNLDIQAKAEELELTTKYKSEFLANMSHELRTPLNSILLLSRLLSENQNGNLNPDQLEYASVIQSSGNGLLRLIDEILDLSKIESGKMQLEYTDTRMDELVNSLKSLFEPIARDKGISFSVEEKNGVPGFLETDRLRLEQILRNLISNALKFTKKGGVQLIISKENSSILFMVKDTGIGIPHDKQQTVFEAFQQADGSTRRQYGGTGLGLSISRELAKLLGGEIRLQSEEGKGSEFTLALPLHRKTAAARKAAETSMYQPLEMEPATGPVHDQYLSDVIPPPVPDDREHITSGDKVILIVEDDTGFARSLLEYTRKKGYKGIVAVRGDEGLSLAKQFMPLGILLDIQLPVKSGWQVMEELKSDNATRPIPVHIMSSHEVKNRSLTKGAADFINKPVAFEKLSEIFQKIEQALSHHPKKVLIVEENSRHAQALNYFLENYGINAEIQQSVGDGIQSLNNDKVNCVILDMGVPAQNSYDMLEEVKKTPGLENLPIIIFTGKNLSDVEEMRIKQYADSIVIKTAHSYQRILDEVSLFLHLVEGNTKTVKAPRYRKAGELSEVLKDKTALIADDDVRNIFSLTKSLESFGMNVLSAIDGRDAVKQLQEHGNVDVVLMDMMMPEMDGYESTREIRKAPKYKNLPIIAVTAKAMTGDREKCIAAGCSDYITKPVDVDQLVSLLRVWLYQ